MEAVAKLRNCPTSPRKMRLVVDNIRGKDIVDAFSILKYTRKEAAGRVEKLLDSAVRNWEMKNEGHDVDEAQLYVKEVYVDSARILKRFQPAPMGRAYRIRKRSNHVTIIVDSRILFDEPDEFDNEEEVFEDAEATVEEEQNETEA